MAQREIDAIAGEYQQDESDSESNEKQQSTESEQQRRKANPGPIVHSESEKASATSTSPPTHKGQGDSFDQPSSTRASGSVPRDNAVKSSASQGRSGTPGRASPSSLGGYGAKLSTSQIRKPPTGFLGSHARGRQVGGSARQARGP